MTEQSPTAAHLTVDEPSKGILRIRLTRSDALNAIDPATLAGISKAFDDLTVRAFLLSSSNPRAFSAGADTNLSDEERAKLSDRLYALYERMVSHPAPIIASISGYAIGAGAQLAIAADLRIGTHSTEFRFVGPSFGLAVGGWGLPSLVGRGRAMDLCMGRTVGADEALAMGLLDRIVDDPESGAHEMAVNISRLQRDAVARVKRIINAPLLAGPLAMEKQGNRDWTGSTSPTGA